jgi:hypothetical protein
MKDRWWSVAAALIVAVVVGLFAPARWTRRLWPGWMWVVPVGTITVLV